MGNIEGSLPGFRMTANFQPRTDRFVQKDVRREISPSVEERHTWEVIPMNPSHLREVVSLFRDYDKPVEVPDGVREMDSLHAHHENLALFTPSNWRDQAAVSKFVKIASKFYFPGGSFVVIAPKTETSVTVERTSWVAMRDGKVVGVYSALSDDPYAPDSDRQKAEKKSDPEKPNEHLLKMAYGHVLIVKNNARRIKCGSYLIAKANDQLFGAGYDQVTGCVDQAGKWSANVDFLHRVGFADDWRKKSAYSYIDGDGRTVNGRRLIETVDAWKKKRDQVYAEIGEEWNIDPKQLKAATHRSNPKSARFC